MCVGGHQDHRQESAGRGQPTEGLPGSPDPQDAWPAQHHQALPGKHVVHAHAQGKRYCFVDF